MKKRSNLKIILLCIIAHLLLFIFLFTLYKLSIFDSLIENTNLKYFGKLPICNLKIERAIIINGFVLPLCARCTGLCLGVFIGGLVTIITMRQDLSKFNIVIYIILLFIAVLDGVLQYFFEINSNNTRRLITGILGGYSFIKLLLYLLFKKLFVRRNI